MAEETALRVCGGARGIKDHCCVADANANTGAVDDVFPDGQGASIERGLVYKARRSLPTQQDEAAQLGRFWKVGRSEEHTSELPSLMRISYAVFCLQKTNKLAVSTIE